ncbi:hypothetical protein TNCV_4247761 [Trichonephila clavipes]|nr:hypothetical protein TNCV_4247761 [Trichonephila clavipes]
MYGSMISDCGSDLNAGNYWRMGSVYDEYCLVRTIDAKVFVKGGKGYQISMTMPAQMSLVKPRQPKFR